MLFAWLSFSNSGAGMLKSAEENGGEEKGGLNVYRCTEEDSDEEWNLLHLRGRQRGEVGRESVRDKETR